MVKAMHVNMPRAFNVAMKFARLMLPKNLRSMTVMSTQQDVVELVGGVEYLPRFWDSGSGSDGLCDDVDRFTALSPAELVSLRQQSARRFVEESAGAAGAAAAAAAAERHAGWQAASLTRGREPPPLGTAAGGGGGAAAGAATAVGGSSSSSAMAGGSVHQMVAVPRIGACHVSTSNLT